MMHQVLYNVHVTLFTGQLHNICLVIPILSPLPFIQSLEFYLSLVLVLLRLVITLDIEHLNTYHYHTVR